MLYSGSAFAQASSAGEKQSLHIVVIDPSGAKVGHAQVRVFQSRSATEAAISTSETNAVGELDVLLPDGEYTLHIEAPGFVDLQQAVAIRRNARPSLTIRLRIAAKAETLDVPSDDTGGISDGEALVFRGQQLRSFSDNAATLRQQINALVQTDDGAAPQLRVDGFSNGRLPPKAAIREIRINQNAYSSQFDERGNSVVEIYTRPGGSKLSGSVYFNGNADPLNARNPYLPNSPQYHSTFLDANLNGSFDKKTSFFGDVEVNDLGNNAPVNAQVLDANFNIVPFSQTVPDPQLTKSANLRIDREWNSRNTLTARAEWSGSNQTNAGIGAGQLVLPSQAYTSDAKIFTLQLSNTTLVSPKTVVESRFQYQRSRTSQIPNSTAAALVVQGGFSGGGSPSQSLRDALDNYEWQEYFSFDRGKHFFRTGVRYRLTRDSNAATANFNGQYTFASLAAYQITVRGLADGLSPAQIRAAGGGASQYNVTAGTPGAVIQTGDLGAYFEDEWKLADNFSLTSGLRYESQFGIPDHNDPAPRLGFAWTATLPGSKTVLFTLRGGVGFFYTRFQAGDILNATRQNGILQRSYFLVDPDTYPNLPDPASLGSIAPSVYQIAPDLRSPYVLSQGVTLQRSLGRFGRFAFAVTHEHGTHQYLSRNANAPQDGVRPLGGTQNVYQYASLGTSDTNNISPSYNIRFGSHGSMYVSYNLRFRDMAGFGPGAFVSNSYNIAADYGRTPSVSRHRVFAGGDLNLPFGFETAMYLSAHSDNRFNITTGQDNNGDSIFNDRPAFATDLGRPSVVRTAFGNFDTAPMSGQAIIPIDYGIAPGLVTLSGQFGREFTFGRVVPADTPAPGAKPAPVDRYFHCFFGVQSDNIFNHVNRATPVGQLTSPYFGRSLTLSADSGSTTAANRVVNLFLSFRF